MIQKPTPARARVSRLPVAYRMSKRAAASMVSDSNSVRKGPFEGIEIAELKWKQPGAPNGLAANLAVRESDASTPAPLIPSHPDATWWVSVPWQSDLPDSTCVTMCRTAGVPPSSVEV